MIEFCLCCPQTCLDVSQALPVGQLGKGHAEKLVPASETLYFVVSIVAFYALPEIVHGNKIYQLGEYGTTRVHQPFPSARMQKYGLLQNIFSNRFQSSLPANPHNYLIYRRLPFKRWDSSDFKYLLDHGWHEPISQALRDNFDNMAQLASKSKAVIIKGTNLGDFQNEVLSWHHINNEEAEDLLPALLITNAHPSYFLESNQTFSGRRNILRVDKEYKEMKMILIPFKKFCKSTSDVISIIEKIFNDISKEKGLDDFQIAQEMKKGVGRAVVDAVILQPNFMGVGFDFKKLIEYLGQ